MRIKKIFADTFKLLLRNKRQSILTSLAIAIATFVVLIVLSSSYYTTESLRDDLNVDKAMMTLTFTPVNILDHSGFTKTDKALIERKIGKPVRLSSSSYGLYTPVSYKNTIHHLSFRSIEDLKDNSVNLPTILNGKDLKNLSNGIAISDKALIQLTHQNQIEHFLGTHLTISGKKYQIQVIYFGSEVNKMLPSLIVSKQLKNNLMNGKAYYDEIIMPTNRLSDVNTALTVLDEKGTHRKTGMYTYDDKHRLYEETEDQATTVINFIAILSSISIFVAGFGVMNAMLSSVNERTKEIAIRRALGAKKSDIHLAYMMEGTILSTIGGFAGSMMALIFVFIMNTTGLQSKLSVSQVLITIGATVLFGVLFSVIPAMVAANKNVVDGLR
ncbi:ABC transporter permease [Staphylococcus muscae]|uniref:ABC transporter permease n=1 Tax=Staphylococcus muscae TaxID=1294 RepID=A0A240C3Y7_9STAP|nr:FtsX-like permease family protein [Staphylococcus muscae]AVQ32852.1 ABC transporter permease [Staphylococcus muscae]PNY98972.1 ABC transporter permease [Staphylococcus muscae]GGA80670.1 ABC transporter permease [Staphylococcus muscae]SNW01856.1 ABC transporter permease [Staphylococcus muscae]